MKLYTIGFTQKTAEQFFGLLKENAVQTVVDIRLRPGGQLAGFAKQADLPFFLDRLSGGCQYLHLPDLAPTPEILDGFRSTKSWSELTRAYSALLDQRQIPGTLERALFETRRCCLLCSCATPDHCHRRLAAERLASAWPGVEIIHL